MTLRIFLGYDPREAIAYHVCADSIIQHTSEPVSITPLALRTLQGVYEETHGDGSNDFTYTRFLVPYLCGFSGLALYLDGDMVVTGDVAELFKQADASKDVHVVKHAYKPKAKRKYLSATQTDYPRKNWSSVILWSCQNYPNRVLTPDYVKKHDGEFLHRFIWLDDHRIGELPKEWNWLCGEYPPNPDAKLYHYTEGTPCFSEYADCDHSQEWWNAHALAQEPIR